ncbi:hypothetical protein [Caulobacter sp. 17J80-11]|uniref:hypothetical protein n=1 Tax=Caulobacter sp. 17J80-11 TaxID=2763502 RepID=UPI001653C092|nr:hypothetical protein [Caulobacter sp. 17J80-11]MBC6980864.1 hypothetical protein [Caulobacter sp. 17J80-11]
MRLTCPVLMLTVAGAVLAAGPAGAEPKGVKYEVSAARDAGYRLKCRFPRTHMGNSVFNAIEFQHTGRRTGRIPADGGVRCTLSKLSGPGPVTLTLFKDGERKVTVSAPGETGHVQAW